MAGTLVRKYRRYSAAERQAIVAECEAPGASVAKIARSHNLNANQVFRWRKQLRGSGAAPAPQWRPRRCCPGLKGPAASWS